MHATRRPPTSTVRGLQGKSGSAAKRASGVRRIASLIEGDGTTAPPGIVDGGGAQPPGLNVNGKQNAMDPPVA
jgi:hypothetical protein